MKKHFFNPSCIRLFIFIFGAIGIGLILIAVFWNPPLFSNDRVLDETLQIFKIEGTDTQDSTITPRIDLPLIFRETHIQTEIIPSQTPDWMVYDGIDIRDKEVNALFSLRCDQEIVYFEPFRIIPYEPGLLQTSEFANDLDFSVAWEHLGYYGLWIHSGLAYDIGELTAYPLQKNFEQNSRGYFRTPDEVDQYIEDCVIKAEMRMHQEDLVSINTIVAAVRVPPSGVDEVSRHVMDLVPYLTETYPDSGFGDMSPPGLLLYFCGQQLTGEMANPNYNKWTQARFIIGVMPSGDD